MDDRFAEGIAEILEIDKADVTVDLELDDDNWNSLAIVSTIALVDELYERMLSGPALTKCKNLAQVLEMIESAKAPT